MYLDKNHFIIQEFVTIVYFRGYVMYCAKILL